MSEEHYQRCRRNIGEYMQLIALCEERTRIERYLKGGATHGPQAHA